jgi:hypothetical protein
MLPPSRRGLGVINVHIDCDPLWVYAQEYGVKPDYGDTSIYECALPAFLELFRAFEIKATFFIIGRDLALPACARFCATALRDGHALGNHTLSHLWDYRRASREVKRAEIADCHDAMRSALGYACKGFRCPGYYFDEDMATVLRDLDYHYDASVLPGVAVYLMKQFYSLCNRAGKRKRFGRGSYLFAARTPGLVEPDAGARRLWEFPIATSPWLRLPIHSTFVFLWGRYLFDHTLRRARRRREHLVYLFHAIDLLDGGVAGALARKVATLKQPLETRARTVRALLTALREESLSLTEDWPAFARLAAAAAA